MKSNDFKCFTSVTWFPAVQRPEPEFKEDTFMTLDGTECKLNAEKEDKIKKAIKLYFKEDKLFTPVKFFENAIEGGNVYVIKVEEKYVGIYEVNDEIKVDCIFVK